MIRFLFCLFFSTGLLCFHSEAATVPAQENPPSAPITQNIQKLPIPEMETLPVKRLTFREKLMIKAIKIKQLFSGYGDGEPTPRQMKQGQLASTFGGIAFLLLLLSATGASVGALALLSLPLGIAALILGIKSTKGNGNTLGILGLVTGAVVTFLWFLAAVLLAVLISAWQ